MTGLDLSGVAVAINAWLVDDLTISRDNGVADDVFDPITLQLTPGATTAVWTGQGAIQPLTGYMAQQDPDVARVLQFTEAQHRALIPLGAAGSARLGDLTTVTAVHSQPGDPKLAGGVFQIVEFGGVSTFAVVRIIYLKQLG